MKLIVCLDDRDGMLFLGRRLSQDSAVRSSILASAEGSLLWMNAYSASQFTMLGDNVRVAEDFLQQAGEMDLCFVENVQVEQYLPLQELTVYRWNRRYPSDVKFPLDKVLDGMHLCRCNEFPGSSHEKITQEVYRR